MRYNQHAVSIAFLYCYAFQHTRAECAVLLNVHEKAIDRYLQIATQHPEYVTDAIIRIYRFTKGES